MVISRIGRMPVTLPERVTATLNEHTLTAKGPKGTLILEVHPFITLTINENVINLHFSSKHQKVRKKLSKLYQSIAGTMRARIYNLVYGVSHGFERKLSLVGVGYKAQVKEKQLHLILGYSHPTIFDIPPNISIETPTQTEILIMGIEKALVGQVAATIRKMRAPEPYKGKGVRYANEVVEIKETKKK